MNVLIVTGADTGVGKTVATAALATALGAAGRPVVVVKPVQTGAIAEAPGDLDEIRRLAGEVPTREFVRLEAPLAPSAAARVAGVTLPPVASHAEAILALESQGTALVEGAGGLLVPLDTDGGTIADLALALRAAGAAVRIVVVVRAGLGTLNHTALTAEALRSRGLECSGLVIGSWPRRPDLARRQNLRDLPVAASAPLLGRLPSRASQLTPEQFRTAAAGWLPVEWVEFW